MQNDVSVASVFSVAKTVFRNTGNSTRRSRVDRLVDAFASRVG